MELFVSKLRRRYFSIKVLASQRVAELPLSNTEMLALVDAEAAARESVRVARQAFRAARDQVPILKQLLADKKLALEQAEAALKIVQQATEEGIRKRASP